MEWGKKTTHENKYLTHIKMFYFLWIFCKDLLKLILSEHIKLNKMQLKESETVTSLGKTSGVLPCKLGKLDFNSLMYWIELYLPHKNDVQVLTLHTRECNFILETESLQM